MDGETGTIFTISKNIPNEPYIKLLGTVTPTIMPTEGSEVFDAGNDDSRSSVI